MPPALDFPSSPTVGQTYPSPAVTGVPVYTWDGEKWTTGAATITSVYVAKAGDTMTGGLTLSMANPAIALNKTAGTGQTSGITGYTNAISRWQMVFGDTGAESGGSAGSDFGLYRFNDAGTFVDQAFGIKRATSSVYFTGDISVRGFKFLDSITNYNLIYDTSGAGALYCGGGTDKANYYRNTTHAFSSIAGTTAFAAINGAGLYIYVGTAYKPGGGVWGDSSDIRIKNVIGDYERGLDDVTKLRPVLYTYKGNDTAEKFDKSPGEDGKQKSEPKDAAVPYVHSPHYQSAKDGTKYTGLIAQEAETVMPELVTKRAGFIDGQAVTDLRDMDTTPLIFALINSVKELKARIEALEAAP